MSDKTKPPGVAEARAAWHGAAPQEVTSSAFAGRFGHWAFEAQSAPVKVVNAKTGAVMGYFVSAREFSEFARLRDRLPRAIHVSEMEPWLIEALQQPLPADYPDLNHLMDDE